MKGPYKLGLTGSIGMGKTTTAAFFAKAGVPVWDADAAVHRLYTHNGDAIAAVGQIVPDAVVGGIVDRAALSKAIIKTPNLLTMFEGVIHPLVAQDRAAFVKQHEHAALIVLDIPLIFEKDMAAEFDGVLVVSTDAATQRARVMARAGMTNDKFDLILSKQVPDAEKRARADFVIETNSLSQTREDVHKLIKQITGTPPDA